MKAIGLDLGGTKFFAGLVNDDGELIDQYKVPTSETWEAIKRSALEAVDYYRNSYDDIVAVGFGVAGMVGLDGYVHYSPNVPAFDGGVPVQQELRDALSIDVFVDNDNNVAGFAEIKYGQAKHVNNALFVGLGTGIGGAIFVDGKLMRGEHGYGGDVGHFQMIPDGPRCACGRNGCFEALASGSALGRIAREYVARGQSDLILEKAGGIIDDVRGTHVGLAANEGDSGALAIMDEYSLNVATGLIGLVNILDPGMIVIGGGVVELGDVLFVPLNKHVKNVAQGGYADLTASIVPATLGERAGLIGAGAFALSSLD